MILFNAVSSCVIRHHPHPSTVLVASDYAITRFVSAIYRFRFSRLIYIRLESQARILYRSEPDFIEWKNGKNSALSTRYDATCRGLRRYSFPNGSE